MRHLPYYWRLRPQTTMYQIPFEYEAQAERMEPTHVGAFPTGDLVGWDANAWPQAGIPFSLFTSQYGTAGKINRSPISYLVEPLDDWSSETDFATTFSKGRAVYRFKTILVLPPVFYLILLLLIPIVHFTLLILHWISKLIRVWEELVV